MRVQNMQSARGNDIPNQFLITGVTGLTLEDEKNEGEYIKVASGEMFQSYRSNIAYRDYRGQIYLDKEYWDYSVTTGKYRNIFLSENKKETQAKIDSGAYILTDLN